MHLQTADGVFSYRDIAYGLWRLLYLDSIILLSYHGSGFLSLVIFTTQSCDDQGYQDVSQAKKRNMYNNWIFIVLS